MVTNKISLWIFSIAPWESIPGSSYNPQLHTKRLVIMTKVKRFHISTIFLHVKLEQILKKEFVENNLEVVYVDY